MLDTGIRVIDAGGITGRAHLRCALPVTAEHNMAFRRLQSQLRPRSTAPADRSSVKGKDVFAATVDKLLEQSLSAQFLHRIAAAAFHAQAQLVGLVAADMKILGTPRSLGGVFPQIEKQFVTALFQGAELPVGSGHLSKVGELGPFQNKAHVPQSLHQRHQLHVVAAGILCQGADFIGR